MDVFQTFYCLVAGLYPEDFHFEWLAVKQRVIDETLGNDALSISVKVNQKMNKKNEMHNQERSDEKIAHCGF